MLARARELGEVRVDLLARGGGCARGAERQGRRPGERRAHQCDRAEKVGPQQRAPGGDRRAEIMADHAGDRAMAERRHQPEHVAHQVGQTERREVAVIGGVPAGGPAVAALVGRDHVIAGRRERQHDLAPAVGELGKAVEQQQAWPARGLEPGLQHMHRQPVDVVDDARADAGWQRDVAVGRRHHAPACVGGVPNASPTRLRPFSMKAKPL